MKALQVLASAREQPVVEFA